MRTINIQQSSEELVVLGTWNLEFVKLFIELQIIIYLRKGPLVEAHFSLLIFVTVVVVVVVGTLR